MSDQQPEPRVSTFAGEMVTDQTTDVNDHIWQPTSDLPPDLAGARLMYGTDVVPEYNPWRRRS